ncbi:OsmC family protein [Nocardioides sp. GXQ0305]|uniref:OsmC family protein n=1 Tax=Nocardioides sp. GXQ0305 TaxID=3423912 RepID=UPI003D7C4377
MADQRDTFRSIELTKIGEARWKATNVRGGETFVGGGGDDPDFTPLELLLAAIAACSAADVDAITRKRAEAESFTVTTSGDKVRDDLGNHLVNLTVTLDVTFPEGEGGDAARAALPRSVAQTRDRLCTVGRTVQVGAPIDYRLAGE